MLLSSEPCLFLSDPFIFMLIWLYQINTSQGGPCTTWQLGLGRWFKIRTHWVFLPNLLREKNKVFFIGQSLLSIISFFTHIYMKIPSLKNKQKKPLSKGFWLRMKDQCLVEPLGTDKVLWTRLTLLPYPNTWISGLISLHSISGRKVHFFNR